MDLKTTQQLLARLYTDESLRKTFFSEPMVVATEFGITDDETRQLAHLSRRQVEGFARSLERKRLQELRRALPETCQVLGTRLEELFGRHAAAYQPSGLYRHAADALAFATFLAQTPSDIPEAISELARYESTWLRFRLRKTWPLIALFRIDPRAVSRTVRDHSPRPRFTIACWFRIAGRVRHLLLTLPIRGLSREIQHRDTRATPIAGG
jgi:hypothetical protein